MKKNILSSLISEFDSLNFEYSKDKKYFKNDVFITSDLNNINSKEGVNIYLEQETEHESNDLLSHFTNVVFLKSSDIKSILELLKVINERVLSSNILKTQYESKANLESLIKSSNSFVQRLNKRLLLNEVDQKVLNQEILEFLEVQRIVLEVSIDLSLYEDEFHFIEFVMKSIRPLKLLSDLRLIQLEQIENYLPLSNEEMIIPSPESDDYLLYAKLHSSSDHDRAYFLLSSLFFELEDFKFQKNRIENVQAVNELWNSAFLNLPSPVALFTKNGELLLHNKLFTELKILPRDCLLLDNGEKVEQNEKIYNVFRKELTLENLKFYIFVFSTVEDLKDRNKCIFRRTGNYLK